MKRSTDRILTTHGGALQQPENLRQSLRARAEERPVSEEALQADLCSAVAAVVDKQMECGLDIVTDGEFGKQNFVRYLPDRVTGFDRVEIAPENEPPPWTHTARDAARFRTYYEMRGRTLFGRGARIDERHVVCMAPLRYVGQESIRREITNLRLALEGRAYEEAFLPAPGPATVFATTENSHYPTDEAYLWAIADVLHEEYKAIADAGFILQIDDPLLAQAWQTHTEMSLGEYQAFTELRVEALNHALRDIPPESVRLHVCWGSWVGPHTDDIPLGDILAILLKVWAQGLSLEAANPRHEQDWHVWETVKLPDDKILIPGVLSHVSDFIEHPQLVADRLVRYGKLVGRENVVAGTDCGLRRVGDPTIAWAKFKAMVEGARLATSILWG